MPIVSSSKVAVVGPLTLDAPTGARDTLDLRVPDDGTNVLQLSNDVWDPDPTDPVATVNVDNNGNLNFKVVSSGKTFGLQAPGGTLDLLAIVTRHWAKALPADATLQNSTFTFWLDDTPGATKLMVKAKDSGGTVRNATIALA